MEELADEILEAIVAHLVPHLCPRTEQAIAGHQDYLWPKADALLALCQVNKRLSRIALPLIYHTLYLIEEGPDIRRVLRKLIQYQHLGQEVQEFLCDHWRTRHDLADGRYIHLSPDRSISKQAKEIIASTTLPDQLKNDLRDGIDSGLEDSELAIIFLLCPNLEVLNLTLIHDFRGSLTGRVLEALASTTGIYIRTQGMTQSQQRLSKIRQLIVRHWDCISYTVDASEFETLLLSPHLQSFWGRSIDFCMRESSLTAASLLLSGGSSSITSATFHNSVIDTAGLTFLLKACPLLQHLHVRWGESRYIDCDIQFDQIGHALRQHGRGVRKLYLDPTGIDDESFEMNSYAEPMQPLGDLTTLTALRHLTVPKVALLGDEVNHDGQDQRPRSLDLSKLLPVSLKRLDVICWENDWDGYDEHLAFPESDLRFYGLTIGRVSNYSRD
jgi:hypothetical protein